MGRWSKCHDQRKGQWLINHLRFNYGQRGNEGRVLFNMSNAEFDKLMEEYNTQSEPTSFTEAQRTAFRNEDYK